MATYTVANGGGNINAASTFVGGVGIPGAADVIDFTATSGQLTVNVATTILDINFSGYSNIITFNNNLSVSRNIILNTTTSTYTTAGGSGIIKTGTGTITSNGKIWTSSFSLGSGTYTITFNDVMNVSGQFNCQLGGNVTLSSNNVLDPERLNIIGNFLTTSGSISGTCFVKFTGTNNQTWNGGYPGFSMSNSIKVDKTGGTLTLSGTFFLSGGTFTYVQGTVDSGTSTLWVSGTTFDTKGSSATGATNVSSTGINWSRVRCVGVLNISSNFTCITQFVADGGSITRTATQSVYLGGDLLMSSTLSSTSTPIIMNGIGTWSSNGVLSAPLTINTSGTITLGSNTSFSTRTLTYISGTVVTTGNRLSCGASCTLNTNGMTWNNITFSGTSQTYTLTSNLNLSGTLALNGVTSMTLTGNTINTSSVSVGNTATVSGTTNIVFNGNGTWSHSSAGYIQNNITINTLGTLTIGANIYYQGGTLTNTAGTVNVTTNSSTLNIGTSCTIFSNGLNWYNITNTATSTVTLTSDLIWTNLWSVTSGTISYAGLGNLAPVSTANISFSGNSTVTLKNNIQITNFTFNGTTVNTNTINISGNLTQTSTLGCSGTTNLVLNGTGTWSGLSSSGFIRNNITIDTLGTLTVSDTIAYDTGTLQYVNGTVNTFGSTFICNTANLIGKITWYNVNMGDMTLTEDFYFNGAFNNSIGNTTINGANIYCMGGTLEGFGNGSNTSGTSKFIFKGNSSWGTNYQVGKFLDIIIDCDTLTLPTSFSGTFATIGNLTCTYLKGKTNKNSCLRIIASLGNSTLINFNKIIIDNIQVAAGVNLNMNEFFSGRPDRKTNILSNTTTNYTITFTDNFEKIAKFVNLSNCTLTRKNQLLMLTNIPNKRTNIGVRFFNTLPNGVAENKPSVNQGMGYGANFLTSDPCFN